MISFPMDCDTPALKTEYLYRAQELLRLYHNDEGKKFRDGVISDTEWHDFKTKVFDPLNDKISDAILEQRELLKHSLWDIDLRKL